MRWLCICLLAACAAPAADEVTSDTSPVYSATAYAVCAACHLDDGKGIPGAFPPLRNRSARMAALDGGREYLISVVFYGLMGRIEAEGVAYTGVMPGHKDALNADSAAAVLNYVVFELNDGDDLTDGIAPFTGGEIRELQTVTAGGSPVVVQQLRDRLLQRYGDLWPR